MWFFLLAEHTCFLKGRDHCAYYKFITVRESLYSMVKLLFSNPDNTYKQSALHLFSFTCMSSSSSVHWSSSSVHWPSGPVHLSLRQCCPPQQVSSSSVVHPKSWRTLQGRYTALDASVALFRRKLGSQDEPCDDFKSLKLGVFAQFKIMANESLIALGLSSTQGEKLLIWLFKLELLVASSTGQAQTCRQKVESKILNLIWYPAAKWVEHRISLMNLRQQKLSNQHELQQDSSF